MNALQERTITPTEEDKRLADASRSCFDIVSTLPYAVRLQFLDEDAPHNAVTLPATVLRLLSEVLNEMAKGNAVTILPNDAMLTTQEAAHILNVSRPFLVGLLEEGRIPYQRLGSHRRILVRDLMAFKANADVERADALRQLTEEAQELNRGY